MCGIYGYSGREDAGKIILEGLTRLEYRGYDSWGIANIQDGKIKIAKEVGAISNSESKLKEGDLRLRGNDDLKQSSSINVNIGIGHTRWATTGSVSKKNSHPHASTDGSFVLAQNGIVENYLELRESLISDGYRFVSETDTEVIVRLIESYLNSGHSMFEALQDVFETIKGRNTVILLTNSGHIYAVRNGSPLVVGRHNKEIFFSSDTLSFANKANKMMVIENGQLITCINNDVKLYELKSGNEIEVSYEPIKIDNSTVDKEGYDHYMIKEISESPNVVRQVIKKIDQRYYDLATAIKESRNVYCIGSGTAGAAASQIAYYLRKYSKINAKGLIGAEASEYFSLFTPDDLLIAPSQSGETADVLEVLEVARLKGAKITSYVNMPGSAISRMSDFSFLANAGPEICVMSTKIFTSQIAWGYLISKIVQGCEKEGIDNIRLVSKEIDSLLGNIEFVSSLKTLARRLSKVKDIFLIGKGQNLSVAFEGMVKIIEGSYIHAHGIPAGDLKHYAITLMEKGVPVIALLSNDEVQTDMISAINEVKARGAETILINSTDYSMCDTNIKISDVDEAQAILNIIPLQLLAYYVALERGGSIDKPRNIAKSVTVK